jgi:predicted O-linked N-acetylglucosamine transferase (SPINDLY family)
MATVAEVLALGLDHQRAGRLDQATAVYRRVLEFDPRQPDALHLLGVIAHQRGQWVDAARLIGAAIQLDETHATYHANLGHALLAQGAADAALAHYRRAVALAPDSADAQGALGSALSQIGEHAAAAASFERAVGLAPRRADLHVNLGRALRFAGRLSEAVSALERALVLGAEPKETLELIALAHRAQFAYDPAIAAYRRALAIDPADCSLNDQLGNVLLDKGDVAAGVAAILDALASAPGRPLVWCHLARARGAEGNRTAAIAALWRALALDPGLADAHAELGNRLLDQGDPAVALSHVEVAVGIDPDFAAAWSNLGNLMYLAGRFESALACHDRVVVLRPEFAYIHLNRATALQALGRIEAAIQVYRQALALDPGNAEAFNNLAAQFQALGQPDEAIRCYRMALVLRPDYATAHSNLLFCLNYDEKIDADGLFAEYRRWEDLHARSAYRHIRPHGNDRDPARRLRVGYLSADFFHHPIATNIVGLIAHHDRTQIEVTCYAEVRRPDRVTRRFEGLADRWRSTVGCGDAEVAEMIRADGIDILVSMAGHTAGNRLGVCAYKPAPIQISYGDLSTTGLEVMDYWLTDQVIHPPGTTERFTETLLHLPLLVLHEPPAEAPDVAPLPALAQGRVSFGSFNNPAKMTPAVVELWARVLQAVPESRLVLGYMHWLDDPLHKRNMAARFAAHGIAADRIVTLGLAFDRGDHLARMAEIDIALDPFPFNGCTATFEALWMGLPVVTLAGRRWLGRMGTSFLTAAGLTQWIAATPEAYVATAAALASDLPALAEIRRTLRPRIQASPLCDGPAYARAVERTYRDVWTKWCHADRH